MHVGFVSSQDVEVGNAVLGYLFCLSKKALSDSHRDLCIACVCVPDVRVDKKVSSSMLSMPCSGRTRSATSGRVRCDL